MICVASLKVALVHSLSVFWGDELAVMHSNQSEWVCKDLGPSGAFCGAVHIHNSVGSVQLTISSGKVTSGSG